jgi:NADPH-dependent curcumin reductase CurA
MKPGAGPADKEARSMEDISQWMKKDRFISHEDAVPGIENFPATMNKLFSGENFGKLVLKITDS